MDLGMFPEVRLDLFGRRTPLDVIFCEEETLCYLVEYRAVGELLRAEPRGVQKEPFTIFLDVRWTEDVCPGDAGDATLLLERLECVSHVVASSYVHESGPALRADLERFRQ